MHYSVYILQLLLVIFLFFGNARSGRAQYTFQSVSTVDKSATTPDAVRDIGLEAANLNPRCLAANGYGQFAASSNDFSSYTGIVEGWFLLGNRVEGFRRAGNDPTGLGTPGVPSGILANGPLDPNGLFQALAQKTIKVAANLQGCARYVWVVATASTNNFQAIFECPTAPGSSIRSNS